MRELHIIANRMLPHECVAIYETSENATVQEAHKIGKALGTALGIQKARKAIQQAYYGPGTLGG